MKDVRVLLLAMAQALSLAYEELVAFPEGLIFYDSGVVHENWSHNQGSRTSESF